MRDKPHTHMIPVLNKLHADMLPVLDMPHTDMIPVLDKPHTDMPFITCFVVILYADWSIGVRSGAIHTL